MPTYAYECQACGHTFEKFQSMSDRALRKCPECGKSKLQRLIGPGAGVIFKGSGFYETDYRSSSYEKARTAEEKSTNGDAGGTADKAEKPKADEKKKAAAKDGEKKAS